MTKSKTKTKRKPTTKSSKPKPEVVKIKVPKLDKTSERAVLTLKSLDVMEFLQIAAPAIRDLGIYNIDGWAGSFDSLYKEIFNSLFDKDRNLYPHWYPVVLELKSNSVCAGDQKMLAAAIARVGATYAFVTISMNRNNTE